MWRSAALVVVLSIVVLAHPAPAKREVVNPYPGYSSATYADRVHWVCRPDMDDGCDHDLDATVVKASGHTRVERWRAARRPAIDCFYIYPTISYLALTVHGNPATDDIGGDLTPEWGMHLIDANVALGDLVAIAGSQAHAYRARHRR